MSHTTPKNRLGELLPAGLPNVDGLFEQFFGPVAARPVARHGLAAASVWEEEGRLNVELDAPGVAKDAVEITFDKGVLDITVSRHRPEGGRVHEERAFGKVTRSLALPETVDPDSLEAELTDGVLKVSVAKRPEAQPKRIELK